MDYNATSNINTDLNLEYEYIGVDGTVNMPNASAAYPSNLGTITTNHLTYTPPYSYSISNGTEIKIHHNDPELGWWGVDLSDVLKPFKLSHSFEISFPNTDDKLDDIDDTENGVLDEFLSQFIKE